MKIRLIQSEGNLLPTDDILFRTYDNQPMLMDISNDYVIQIHSKFRFEVDDEDSYKKFHPKMAHLLNQTGSNMTAQHLQGIKSAWYNALRFFKCFDEPELNIVFLNEHSFYQSWMNDIFCDTDLNNLEYDKN